MGENSIETNEIHNNYSKEHLNALIEDYKVRSNDVRMRSSQYERLWLALVAGIGALLAWSLQYNIANGKSIFEPNGIILLIPFLILVWSVFMIYVLSCNKLLTLYMLRLENEIRECIKAEINSQIPMRWKSHFQQITQRTYSWRPTSIFAIPFFILIALVIFIFVMSSIQTMSFLNASHANLGYTILVILFVLAIFLVFLYFSLHRLIKNHSGVEENKISKNRS